ncbi:hypothetical protein DY000_02037865 [Brassica cretica]|uniref:Uncharacterized protein n=2 Tax=Brassica cretica TaxID=69181 RepID=A0ABQ7B7W8_BRACR|nr:hypothetical protein DY000_02037865 [Brassica cretica]
MKIPRNISLELPRIGPSESPSKYPEEILPRYIPRTFRRTGGPRSFLRNSFPRNSVGNFQGISEEKRISEDLFRQYVVGITLFRRHTDDFFPRYVAVFL